MPHSGAKYFKDGESSPHLVVIDDSLDHLQLLEDFFINDPIFLTTFVSPKIGLEFILQQNKPYKEQNILAMVDVNMVELGGLEVLSQIRQFNAQLPVIMTSSFGDKFLQTKAHYLGAKDFLVKPFSLLESKKIIFKILNIDFNAE